MKKTKIILTLFLLIILTTVISNASYSTVKMSVVEEPVSTINFGTNSYVERSVISKNLENKDITLQLKVVNNEKNLKPTGELMLVIDNSKSMIDSKIGDKTREEIVINSAKTLITNLLKDNPDLKIGAVSFSTNSDISKEGTIEDAQLVSKLTNNVDNLISSVSNIPYTGPRTNLDAGITLAKKYFSENTDNSHKYIIVLSDGVPNVAIDYDKKYFSDDVIEKTKSSLLSLSSITNNVIIMLTGIPNGSDIATPATKTYDQIINEIFGSTTKPTIGKFYYITDNEIENTITSNIYKDLLPVSHSFKNLIISDYFTKEIVENFDFSYVKDPNFGTISEKIDTETNSITWTIPELKSGETAIVQYKLKLKENYSSNILDKVIDTNTKLELNYTDSNEKTETKTSTITPKVKLVEPTVPKEEPKKEPPTVEKDLPKVLPKAGTTTLFTAIVLTAFISTIIGIRYYLIKLK